jgi:hypothetical protein
MIKIKLTTEYPEVPIVRQTPYSKGVWDNCQFFINDDTKEFDWWFIWNNLSEPKSAHGPKNRTVLMTGENSGIKTYRQDYIDQFGHIITCQNIRHPHITHRQIYHWHIGMVGTGSGILPKDYPKYYTPYEKLKEKTWPEKTKLISAVVSCKNRTEGQRKRHLFIKAMKKHFGDKMDVYGAGINFILDKWDAIAPYKYYLAIENSFGKDYLTEKIADAYLGYSFPFFYGAPNADRYFSKDAFMEVDVNDYPKSIAIIEKAIAENTWEKRRKEIEEARTLVLDKYNAFAVMAEFANAHMSDPKEPSVIITLYPEKKPFMNKIVAFLRKLPAVYSPLRSIYRKYRQARYSK